MNCPNCGADLPQDSRFCGSCGRSIESTNRPGPPPPQRPQAGPPPIPQRQQSWSPPPPQPQQGGYYDPQGGAHVVQEERTNAFAIVSLISGILTLPCCLCSIFSVIPGLAGIIFGAVALSQISSNPQMYKGKGLAIAGIICSIIGIILGVGLFIFSLLSPGSMNTNAWQRF